MYRLFFAFLLTLGVMSIPAQDAQAQAKQTIVLTQDNIKMPSYEERLTYAREVYTKICDVASQFGEDYPILGEQVSPTCDLIKLNNLLKSDSEAMYESVVQVCAVNFVLGTYVAIQEYAQARMDGLINTDMGDYLALSMALNNNYVVAYADVLRHVLIS